MRVEFHRTGHRRYMVRTIVEGQPPLIMDPAPGYDDVVPHDLFHYVVERELGVELGIFGQLAAGGDAGSFYLGRTDIASRARSRLARRIKAKGRKLEAAGRADAAFSERALGICEIEWHSRAGSAGARSGEGTLSRSTARALAECSDEERSALTPESITRVCERLAELGASWSQLEVGQALTLEWRPSPEPPSDRRRYHENLPRT